MTAETEFGVALTTTNNPEEADLLAERLVSEKLAACVQIIQITSHYVWKGRAQKEPEFLLLIKSRRAVYEQIEAFLRSNHSYETPELIWLPVEAGLGDYLSWIRENTLAE